LSASVLPKSRRLYLDRFLGVYDGNPFLVRLLMPVIYAATRARRLAAAGKRPAHSFI
jgi:hypothetical protein